MKGLKITAFILIFLVFCYTCRYSVNTYAHKSNLGIEGYDGINYDECQPNDTYHEKWYGLRRVLDEINRSSHIDDDLFTLYYQIINDGASNNTEWNANYLDYVEFIKMGIDQWNYVSAYEMNDEGIYEISKIVNLVDINTLEDPSSVDVNIEIHMNDDENPGCAGSTIADFNTEVLEDYQEYNGIKHIHYTKYIITLYPHVYSGLYRIMDEMFKTTAHEIGHVFGLIDLDYVEAVHGQDYHHQEILMGYSSETKSSSPYIQYQDLAGVLVSRGIHENDEHKWLYDASNSGANNYKLICSVCNCVKYVTDLEEYSYSMYQNCNNVHTIESGNMMPVARFHNTDYMKCKYCRHINPFDINVVQRYLYCDNFDNNNHYAQSIIPGGNYKVIENHDYTIDLGNGIKKCYLCPKCNDGSISMDYTNEINLECIMPSQEINLFINAYEYKILKLNPSCHNIFNIVANSNNDVEFDLFDYEFKEIDINTTRINNQLSYSNLFYKRPYYLRIRFANPNVSGNISLNVSSNNEYCQVPINYLDEIDIYAHMHNSRAEFLYRDSFDRFIEIKLNVVTSSGNPIFLNNTIRILDNDGNPISKFKDDINDLAISKYNQYSMYVFLEKDTDYIIEINYNNTNVESATICLEMVESIAYDCVVNPEITVEETDEFTSDEFIRINPSQAGKYKMIIDFYGEELCDAKFAVISHCLTGENLDYYINYTTFTNIDEYQIDIEAYFSPNTMYYIGFFGGNVQSIIDIKFMRVISNESMDVLIDPSTDYGYGSEVRLNGGIPGGTFITEGHTRLIFFENTAPSVSRLDYYWYSNNEDVATVTEYGTVLAKNVTQNEIVFITAVYKYDFSKVFRARFTIVKDTDTSIKFIRYDDVTLTMGEFYQPLPDNRWPSTYLQHYDWESNKKEYVNLSIWGIIRPARTGTFTVTGTYKYNSKYRVVVEVSVT